MGQKDPESNGNEGVMVPTIQTIVNSSYYYEYQENIHLSVKLISS